MPISRLARFLESPTDTFVPPNMLLLPKAILAFHLLLPPVVFAKVPAGGDGPTSALSFVNYPRRVVTMRSSELGFTKRDDRRWELQDDYSGDCFFDGYVASDTSNPLTGTHLSPCVALTFSMPRIQRTDVSNAIQERFTQGLIGCCFCAAFIYNSLFPQ